MFNHAHAPETYENRLQLSSQKKNTNSNYSTITIALFTTFKTDIIFLAGETGTHTQGEEFKMIQPQTICHLEKLPMHLPFDPAILSQH